MARKKADQSTSVVLASDHAALPLPTGAATSAKQPALGTAGTPSADVITVQGITSGQPVIIGGAVAAGASDSGNPVKVGGKYAATMPTYTDGQRTEMQFTTRGALKVALFLNDSATAIGVGSGSDVASNAASSIYTIAAGYAFDGTAWQRNRQPTTFKSIVDASVTAGTGVNAWTPTSTKKFRLLRGQLSLSVAGQIIFWDNSNAVILLRSPKLAAAQVWDFDLGSLGILSGAADRILKIDVTSNANVGGWVAGTEE